MARLLILLVVYSLLKKCYIFHLLKVEFYKNLFITIIHSKNNFHLYVMMNCIFLDIRSAALSGSSPYSFISHISKSSDILKQVLLSKVSDKVVKRIFPHYGKVLYILITLSHLSYTLFKLIYWKKTRLYVSNAIILI